MGGSPDLMGKSWDTGIPFNDDVVGPLRFNVALSMDCRENVLQSFPSIQSMKSFLGCMVGIEWDIYNELL